MKTSNVVKLSLVVVIVAFVSSVTGYIFGARADDRKPVENPPGEVAVESTSHQNRTVVKETEKIVTQTYLLKETDGKLALYYKYSDGGEKLYKSYDIPVKSLPRPDRELLEKGIEVKAISEALQLIEDYM